MKHIIHIRLLLLMLLFACICHTPTMAYTQPTPSAATMAGTDDENTEDDTGGTGDNTGNDTGGDTGGDTGTTLPADREPVDVAKYIWWIDDDFEHRTTVTLTASNAVSSSIEDIDVSEETMDSLDPMICGMSDVRHYPYKITPEKLREAIKTLQNI